MTVVGNFSNSTKLEFSKHPGWLFGSLKYKYILAKGVLKRFLDKPVFELAQGVGMVCGWKLKLI
jgi:hypothetical protein